MNEITDKDIKAEEIRLDIAAGILRCPAPLLKPLAEIISYDRYYSQGYNASMMNTSIGSLISGVEGFAGGHPWGKFYIKEERVTIPVQMPNGWTINLYPNTQQQREAIEFLIAQAQAKEKAQPDQG
jgi:hypothetical protein